MKYALVVLFASTAASAKPMGTYVVRPPDPANAAVTSNIIFLNNCQPNGCAVHYTGSDNAQFDNSSIGGGTLQAFNASSTTWNEVVQCVNDVFRDFNVQIVTTRPTSGSYLEIMIAGKPEQIGLTAGCCGGIAPFKCQAYQANALVFDFANVYAGSVEDMCATAAQEIAHTWSLDHSTDKNDPMTYYTSSTRKYYADLAQQCGSDCINGVSPFNQTCTGSPPQNHPCSCTGQNTQNSHATIIGLFGQGTPAAPMVTIKYPSNNQDVAAGFNVTAEVSSIYGGSVKAQLLVDNQPVLTINSPPFAFNAPSSLAPGAHMVTVIGTDMHGVTAMTSMTANVVPPCTKPGDCPNNTDVCAGGLCEPGSSVQGGLGTTCTDNSSCASGSCAADDTGKMLCTVPCDPATSGSCPGGFQCLQAGASGVCWPASSGGGCDVSGGGPLMFGLTALAGLLATRRRARA